MLVDPNEDSLTPYSEAAAFYAQMGKTVALWAQIEGYVFELFAFALVTDKYKAALLFERFGTISARMQITDALLKVSMNKKWYEKWRVLYKTLDGLIKFRNQIAHNPVDKSLIPKKWSAAGKFHYFSFTAKAKYHKTENFIADLDDIKAHNEQVKAVSSTLSTLGVPVRARRRPSIQPPPRFPLCLVPDHPANARKPAAQKRRRRSSQAKSRAKPAKPET